MYKPKYQIKVQYHGIFYNYIYKLYGYIMHKEIVKKALEIYDKKFIFLFSCILDL